MQSRFIRYIFLIAFTFLGHTSIGQTTLIIKPSAIEGIDASVCSSPSWDTGAALNGKNFGNLIYQRNASWTANLHGEPEHDWRSLIKFDALDTLQNLNILSAHIKMYYPPNYPYANGGRDGINESRVYQIAEPWSEMEVTWLNQPAVRSTDPILIPTNNNYETITVEVTDWVREMVADPSTNHGFFFIPVDDSPYRSMSFASSDHEDEDLWPELVIEHESDPADTCQFRFPNVFTPDGNKVNDIFSVVSNCESGYSVEMVIYDRWGNWVFQSTGASPGWDGTMGGKAAAAGVYIYSAKVESVFDELVYRGSVTLIR